jgi:hypothetical protein
MSDTTQITHADGCWTWGRGHYECALARVEQQREKVAAWIIAHSFATGHGDTLDDLLAELSWQVEALRAQSRSRDN